MDTLLRSVIGLVDDDASVRRGVSRLLRSAGLEVRAFASGEECLACAEVEELSCLLVDIHLGGMSGFDLWHKLQKKGIDRPVIFITAFDESLTREALLDVGSPVCLRKPVDAEFLLAAIRQSLNLR